MCQGVHVETKRQFVRVGSSAMWVHRDQTSVFILAESVSSTKPSFIPSNFFLVNQNTFCVSTFFSLLLKNAA